MTALATDLSRSEVFAADSAADSRAYDSAAAFAGIGAISPAPPLAEGSAYFSAAVDFPAALDRKSLVGPLVDRDDATPEPDTAGEGEPSEPPVTRGFAMSLRRLAVRVLRALKQCRPMFPPMSCC